MEHVADYIRSNYSADGLEVTRVGKKQLVITCPPELPDLTNLCKTLEIEFDAEIDLAMRNKTIELLVKTDKQLVARTEFYGIALIVLIVAIYMTCTRWEIIQELTTKAVALYQ